MANTDQILEGLSDEQLLALIKQADKKDETPVEKPERIQIQLADGTSVEAADKDELNRLLAAKLDEYVKTPREEVKQTQGPERPSWDYEKFSKSFIKDPREGMDYLDQVETGVSVRKAFPAVLTVLGQMAKKLQDLEAQRFLDTNPEYDPNSANKQAIERIITERGWQPSFQSYQDAFDIAKSRGVVKAKDAEKPESKAFIPPRTPKTGIQDRSADAELMAAAQDMPLEKLADILAANGILRRS